MSTTIRPIEAGDEQVWRKHWAAYNEFYHRTESITEEITATVFSRFLSKDSTIQCAVAVSDKNEVVGFVTWFPHPSTYLIEDMIYLNDLFVDPECRNGGIGRKLIEHVYAEGDKAGTKNIYWHTQYAHPINEMMFETNADYFVRGYFNHRAQLLYTKVGTRTDFIMYSRP